MKLNHVMSVLFVLVAAFALAAFRPLQVGTPPVDGTPVAVVTATPAAVTVEPVPVAPAAPATDPGPDDLIFVAELVAITGFFAKRFGLSGYALMGAAFVVGAVLWFSPLLAQAFPAASAWINSGVLFVKLYLSGMGSVDVVTGIGAKIATAKMTGDAITVGSTTK